jgi:hypothetical protein
LVAAKQSLVRFLGLHRGAEDGAAHACIGQRTVSVPDFEGTAADAIRALDAMRVFDRLAEQAHKLETFAERGRRLPELGARQVARRSAS